MKPTFERQSRGGWQGGASDLGEAEEDHPVEAEREHREEEGLAQREHPEGQHEGHVDDRQPTQHVPRDARRRLVQHRRAALRSNIAALGLESSFARLESSFAACRVGGVWSARISLRLSTSSG